MRLQASVSSFGPDVTKGCRVIWTTYSASSFRTVRSRVRVNLPTAIGVRSIFAQTSRLSSGMAMAMASMVRDGKRGREREP